MLIGYARVSTDDQHLDLQRDALAQAGCLKLYEDRESGAKAARPGLTLAVEVLREGDTLVVWRLDRLGRSLKDLIALVETLEAKGIGLKSLKENIDTTSGGGKLVFHLLAICSDLQTSSARPANIADFGPDSLPISGASNPHYLPISPRFLTIACKHPCQPTLTANTASP